MVTVHAWYQKLDNGNSGNPVVPNIAAIANGLFKVRRMAEMDQLTSLSLNEEDGATFNGVKAKFDAYFIGSRNVIYERAKFNQRKQTTGEPVDSFITSLHKLIEHCDYGHGALKEEMIRDEIGVGVVDEQLSEKLQLYPNLTLKRAVDQSRQKEAVRNQQAVVRCNPLLMSTQCVPS